MQAPPHKRNAVKPGWGDGVPRDDRKSACAKSLQRNARSAQALVTVAEITKSYSSRVRVSLSTWKGEHKVELRDLTATIPGCFFPTRDGVTLDVARLHELIAALQRSEAEAISRGMLPNGRAA